MAHNRLRPEPPAMLALLHAVEALARQAGVAIMDVYAHDFEVVHKADASPLTLADARAEALIVPGLQALDPGVPVVAEEAVARDGAPAVGRRFWLVDPLDGTREFVLRNGEFTVNMALVEDGVPVLGVVYAPALDRMFCGAPGFGAWLEEGGQRRTIACRPRPAAGATVAVSRAYGDGVELQAWLATQQVAAQVAAGSALKFGLLAAGEADLYPRFGRTMEWDTAAGHAVLLAAGGQVQDLRGQALGYGKPGFENPHFLALSLALS